MIFATVLLFCLASAVSQSIRQALPNPIVDVNELTGSAAPWSEMCCVLSKAIRKHFYYQHIIQYTDHIAYDVDYFCDHLAYGVTQLAYVQKSVHDCGAVSAVVTKMVAQEMFKTRSHTAVSVMNSIVLAVFRSYSERLIDGSNAGSVMSIISRSISTLGLDAKEVAYIKRRAAYHVNCVYTMRLWKFLERVELSQTLIELQSLNKRVMTIINGTTFNVDSAVAQVKTAVKATLRDDEARAFGSYKLRAYYIAYFRATLSSAHASAAADKIRSMLSHVGNGGISASQVSAIVSAVTNALSSQEQWLTGFLQGLVSRNMAAISQALVSTGGSSGVSISASQLTALVNKLGWINLRIAPRPRNLLQEYKELLGDLTKYKAQMQSFAASLDNRPSSERHYHASSISFIQSLISAIQDELKDSSWVHTFKAKHSVHA